MAHSLQLYHLIQRYFAIGYFKQELEPELELELVVELMAHSRYRQQLEHH